jgi:hypothetical protein
MNLKNLAILILGVLFCLVIISQVGASENITYFENSTNVTFEGVNFTIPAGFGVHKANEKYDKLGSEGKTCFYTDEENGKIIITVISDWMGLSLDELKTDNCTKTKINGHEGWNYTEGNLHYFAYVKGEKGVLVGVTNETRLNEVIL